MHQRERRLVTIAVTALWLGALGHGEAIAQRTRMLEFGPDAIEAEPLPRAARDGGAPVGPRLGVGAQIAAPARRTRERAGVEGDAEAGGWRGRGGAR